MTRNQEVRKPNDYVIKASYGNDSIALIAWAQSKPGTYVEGQQDMFDCDAGWCGS